MILVDRGPQPPKLDNVRREELERLRHDVVWSYRIPDSPGADRPRSRGGDAGTIRVGLDRSASAIPGSVP